jgi:hypothetical protein
MYSVQSPHMDFPVPISSYHTCGYSVLHTMITWEWKLKGSLSSQTCLVRLVQPDSAPGVDFITLPPAIHVCVFMAIKRGGQLEQPRAKKWGHPRVVFYPVLTFQLPCMCHR